jgi:4-hydroxy-3-polyprenylbenzoate decarboxylase
MAASLSVASVEDAAAELGTLVKAKPPASFREALSLLGTALELRHAKPKSVRTGPCKEVIRRFETPSNVGQASRLSPDEQTKNLGSQHGQDASKPATRDRQDACPTLLNLPIQKCWPLDGGRFITLPCVVTKDPDTGERNVGDVPDAGL